MLVSSERPEVTQTFKDPPTIGLRESKGSQRWASVLESAELTGKVALLACVTLGLSVLPGFRAIPLVAASVPSISEVQEAAYKASILQLPKDRSSEIAVIFPDDISGNTIQRTLRGLKKGVEIPEKDVLELNVFALKVPKGAEQEVITQLTEAKDKNGMLVVESAQVVEPGKFTDLTYHPFPAIPVLTISKSEILGIPAGVRLSTGYYTNDTYNPSQKNWDQLGLRGIDPSLFTTTVATCNVDGPVDITNPDLANVVSRTNSHDAYTKDNPNGVFATTGSAAFHGSATASITSAEANNNLGIAGMVPHGEVWQMNTADPAGFADPFAVARGIYYCSLMGARVIEGQMAFAYNTNLQAKAVNYAYKHGAFITFSAGNIEGPAQYPARLNHVTGVTGVDENNVRISGLAFEAGVDFATPGYGILASVPCEYAALPDGCVGLAGGTSGANPQIAALAMMEIQKNPNITPDQIYTNLANSSTFLVNQGTGNGIPNATLLLK